MHDVLGGLLLAGSQEPTQPLGVSPPTPSAPHDGERVGRAGARKLMGQDEVKKITHISLSWAKQNQLGEFDLTDCQLT